MGKKSKKFQGPRRPIQPTFNAPAPPLLNTGYKDAAIVTTRGFKRMQIVVAGCGGIGAYVVQHVGRIMQVLYESQKGINLTLVDPDIVEEKNLGRQLFCIAEVGEPKAVALARRYGQAWELNTLAVVGEYHEGLLLDADMTLLVGCVDNAAARATLAGTLKRNQDGLPSVWWLDCGNLRDTGRVLLGSAYREEGMRGAFIDEKRCVALPSPALQYPSLLIPQPEELTGAEMSCAEMAVANLQSLNINAAIAVQAADMLTRLLITKDLKRFACGVNVAAGSVKSSYVTPENVAREIERPVHFVRAESTEGDPLGYVRAAMTGREEAA